MNTQEFVDAIRLLVMEAAVSDTVSVGLSGSDREMMKRMLELVSRQAVFGFLAVLDGARKVGSSESGSGHFELRSVHGTAINVLCGPDGDSLHELL
jgi:hypothetical protein